MESDSESESGSQDYDLHNWPDMNSDDLEFRYSSDDAGSESDYDYPEMLREADEPQFKTMPSFPVRSIPYSSYLKRFAVKTSRPGNHRNPYLPPPRVSFMQSQTGDILDDVPRHHPCANFDEAFGTNSRQEASMSSAQPKGQDHSDEKRSTIIVEATQDVKILLTPILLKIIQEFLEAINAEEWDLETMLDVTQMEYVELLTRMQPSKLHSQQFVVSVPRVHLRFIQDVMMPDALNGGDDINMIKTRYELSGANLCAIDIVLDDAAIIAAVKFEDEEFEKFEPGKIHIASFKVVESRANVDFSKFKLNARFVSTSTARIFGIPDARHQFSRLGINHLSYLNEPVIADISFEHFKLRLVRSSNPNYFSANLEKFAVMFINQSAEIVAGSLCSWLTFVKDLKTILGRFQLRRSKQLQTLFSEIARFSGQKAINTDPIFLTRPSTTLRLGTMFSRNDDGWKLLAHIRHCMRLMPRSLMDTLQDSLKKPELETFSTDTMYDIVISVFSNWRSWEMDDLRHCRLFSDVFERKPVPNADKSASRKESLLYEMLQYSANSIQLRLGEFEAAIYDEQMENRMRVTGLEFNFESRYRPDVLAQVSLFPGVPIANETNRLTTGFLDVAVKTGFSSAEIDVNPVIIAFTRHILRVERIFTPQFNKILESSTDKRQPEGRKSFDSPSSPRQSIQLTRETPAVTTSTNEPNLLEVIDRFDVVFNGMAVVETIRITMTAHNLSAQVIFSQIQVSALNFAKQRTFPTQDIEGISVARSSGSNPEGSMAAKSGFNKLIASLATNISSINSSLKERIYSKDSASSASVPTKELLTFGIVGINSEATLSQFTPAKRPKQTKVSVPREVINLLVTFKQVNIALPRSILKLYLFAKDWREENMQSFDFLFQGVMNEWEADRKTQPKVVTPSVPRELKVQIVLKTLTLESHMLPSLLFQYEAADLMIMLHDVPPGLPFSVPQLTYTVQLLRQSVDFIANQSKSKAGERSRLLEDKHAASFSLPVIRASGSVMNVVDTAAPARTRRSSISALARGARHPKKLESSVSFDFVEMTLNVNMLDHILTAQSLLGAELNELIDILSNGSKPNPASASSATTPPATNASAMLYSVKVTLVGLSIAAISPSAILYFESDLLKGVITNNPSPGPVTAFPADIVRTRLAWRLYAQSITLSLNHHVGNIRLGSRAEDMRARKLRLAYITINLNVQNFSPKTSDKDRFLQTPVSSFYVSLLRVHALMQPQSVSRIIGLYSYYTQELERRKELKASDMAKLADNTKRIIKSLDVDVPTYKDNTRSILEATEIFLKIEDVAVAIPLDRREDIMDSSERLVEAFLISATLIEILTKSGETSSGTLSHLCAQFVPRFDQSKDEHFRSRSHPKMNRLSFPNISCQVEASKSSPGHQEISSKATVSGFELDIDPTIVRYINTLSDVYDNSKDLVISLNVEQAGSAMPGATKPDSSTPASTPKIELAPAPQTSSLVVWKIENTFQCSKSVCRFYPKSYVAKLPKTSKFMDSEANFAHVGAEVSGVDRFIIPGLSLWVSLRFPLGDDLAELQAAGPPRIHAEVNIHSCENTFYPSLVPFFQDIVSGLKIGIRRQRQYSESELLATSVAPSTPSAPGGDDATQAGGSLNETEGALQQVLSKRQALIVSCYLFIEKTTIEFNCQPMAKVMSVLTFEQGNILVSYNSERSGNSSSTIAGTFEGASSDTHHIFSQDKGFKLETKGLIFNAVAETKRQADVNNKKTLSVAVDFRKIAIDFDLRQAEILVLMKMIWMDQANYLIRDGLTVSRSTSSAHGFEPSVSLHSPNGTEASAASTGGALVAGKRESSFLGYNVFVAALLQQMRITGDLGSQIGKMDFKLDDVRLRTKLRPFHPRSASITTGPLDLQFLPMERGWLEGYMVIEGLSLQTLAKVTLQPTFPCSIMEVVLQTKRMTSMLSYDYKKFLILAVEPARLVLQDHWNGPDLNRDVSHAIIAHLQGLRLLAGAKTVPVFKHLMSRLLSMMEQKQSAAKEELKKPLLTPSSLQQASTGLSPSTRPRSPSSNDSMPISLQNRIHTAWNAVGRVQVSVGDLDLSFFPYFLSDKECTHASVQGVKASLDRYLIYSEVERPVVHRLTSIDLALLSLQKYTLQSIDQSIANRFTLDQWFERIRNPTSATIAKLPATSQVMESWQAIDSQVIEHICRTQFAGLIDIATDYRLFRGVEKNFQRFLEELSIRNFKDSRNLAEDSALGSTAAATMEAPVNTGAVGVDAESLGGHALAKFNSHDATSAPTNEVSTGLVVGQDSKDGGLNGTNAAAAAAKTHSGAHLKSAADLDVLANGSSQAFETTPVPAILPPASLSSITPVANGLVNVDSEANGTHGAGAAATSTSKATATTKATSATASPTAATAGDATDASEANGASVTDSKESQLTFQAREQIVFQPALDILPNTPLPLGHLGFKKEDIPPIVHVVTTGLETGLLTVAEFHAEKVEASGLHDLWEGRVAMDDEES
ncbi:hypothetical protein EC968_009280 [Mortierella alpina]|nr:hypothetical protein EC968_009280 [Mortierella alpina]